MDQRRGSDSGALQRTVFPPERMDVGVTLVDVEEVVKV
jgi:hypothetical protein